MNRLVISLLCGGAWLLPLAAVAQTEPAQQNPETGVPGTNAGDKAASGGASTAPSDTIAASQGTAPPIATQPDNAGLTDIVVTAQRRAQNLLSVPLSISASTGEQLVNVGIRELPALQFTTPGFVPSSGFGYTQIYIRGIGNNIYVGADPSIASFIDDVPRIYGSLVNNFVNVERVEVLKGAQGGLYGRNATGGVVNIITRQPSDTLEASGRVSYGERRTFQAAGYLNLPLSDRIALNLSVERDSHAGYARNLATADPYNAANFPTGSFIGTPQQTADFFNSGVQPTRAVGKQDFWAADAKLRIKLTDNLKLTLAGDYNRKDDDSGNQEYNATPQLAQGLATALFRAFGINSALPPNFFKLAPRKFTVYKAFSTRANLRDYGGSITAVWTLPGVELTSITAYRKQRTDYFDDGGDDNVGLLVEDVRNRKHFVYQELRAVSTGAGPFHLLGGATYLSNHFAGQTTISYLPPLPTLPATVSTDVVHNYSVYGQVGYDLTDALSLTGSLRYIHETNRANFTQPVIDSASLKERKLLPAVTLSYKLDGGGNIYARYARGFKGGGINATVPPSTFPSDFGRLFAPETVDTFEAGYRAPLFNRQVQLTTAVFYNNYRGLQTQTNGNATHPDLILAIINAGTARTYGAEASVTWRIAQPFTIGVNAGYLNARYKQFSNTDGSVLSTFDFDGRRMIFSPKLQLGFTGDLDQPLNDSYRLVGSALVSHLSRFKFYNAANGIPDPIQRGYWLANARMGVRTTDSRWELAAFANNLFNKGYATVANASVAGTVFGWGNPRIIGGEVRFRY